MLWSPCPTCGRSVHLSGLLLSSSPHPEDQLEENKWEVSVSSGALNEMASVLSSFLRNFRELHRGQASLKPTIHRRLGGPVAWQQVAIQREGHWVA